jgi:hypothetical protein
MWNIVQILVYLIVEGEDLFLLYTIVQSCRIYYIETSVTYI